MLCGLENSCNILWKPIQSFDSVNETTVAMCRTYQKLLIPVFFVHDFLSYVVNSEIEDTSIIRVVSQYVLISTFN